ncbi:MAG TPA: hypothetical protein VFK31_03800 [Rhodanobacteraceae bacterium]|nr:hypothetical protein [Rhodanobacteraceae bacterium]
MVFALTLQETLYLLPLQGEGRDRDGFALAATPRLFISKEGVSQLNFEAKQAKA